VRKPSFSNFPLSKLSFIDRLPRQARDKHTESSKHDFPSHTAAVAPSVGTLVLSHNQVGKRVCLRQFMLEIIILPRHARDKHTESTQKILRFGTLSHNQRLLGNALVQEDDLDKHINAQGLSPGCEICIF